MVRPLFAALLAISVTSVAVLPTSSRADERCQQLESLHAEYAGAKLTPKQTRLKRKILRNDHLTGNTLLGAGAVHHIIFDQSALQKIGRY